MLAYSSIGQAGSTPMTISVAERKPDALSAVSYYLIAYLCMNSAVVA